MKRALLVGAGGWARSKWVNVILPDFKDRVAVAGMVVLQLVFSIFVWEPTSENESPSKEVFV